MPQYQDSIVLPEILAKSDLYYQNPDILIDDEGDLRIDESGDLFVDKTGIQAFRAEVIKRVLTETRGLSFHPSYGAGLDAYIGEPLSPELSTAIKSKIYTALTSDDFARGSDIIMELARIDENTLAIVLIINIEYRQISVPLALVDLQNGRVYLGE
jgi:hypothetical protein